VPPFLLRTTAAITDCELHLRAANAFSTPIEGYLTQYLLVLLCADMQQEICSLVAKRGGRSGDPHITSYAAASATRVFRSVAKADIAKLAAMFGTDINDRLSAALDERQVTLYGNAVNNRHQVAHYSGVSVSFRDIKAAAEAAQGILVAFESALS